MARKKKSSWIPFVSIVGVLALIGIWVFVTTEQFDLDGSTYAYTDDQFVRETPVATIIEFGDFQCPACGQFASVMKQLKEQTEAEIVYKHFPLAQFPFSLQAAEASECARNQNRFWAYHDILFDNQQRISPSFLRQAAEAIGLDMNEWRTCVDNRETQIIVAEHMQEAQERGVSGTPTVFINDEEVPYRTVQQFITHIQNME